MIKNITFLTILSILIFTYIAIQKQPRTGSTKQEVAHFLASNKSKTENIIVHSDTIVYYKDNAWFGYGPLEKHFYIFDNNKLVKIK